MRQSGANPKLDTHDNAALLRILFRGKWRLKVIHALLTGALRLSQLRRAIPDCSKKVLIDTLHDLEAVGWIVRNEYPTKVKRVEYSPSEQWEAKLRQIVADFSREI